MVTTLKKTNKKGFTLVELVIVIAILAILAAIAIPTVTNVIGTANTNTDLANAQTIELALKSASAETAAGTWKVTDPTVAAALTHEGLDLAAMNTAIRSVSGGLLTYTSGATSGKITVSTVSTTQLDLAKKDLKLSDYLTGK